MNVSDDPRCQIICNRSVNDSWSKFNDEMFMFHNTKNEHDVVSDHGTGTTEGNKCIFNSVGA